MSNFDVSYFRPLWIRLAVPLAAIGWAIDFLGLGLLIACRFFATFNPEKKE